MLPREDDGEMPFQEDGSEDAAEKMYGGVRSS
jgi:hypothetical protein